MASSHVPSCDFVLPFLLKKPSISGKAICLKESLDHILKAHAYPQSVSQLLAELITLAAGLSSSLKFSGLLSLQINGEGPLSTLVADITEEGHVRGYANYKEQDLNALGENPSLLELFGKGYLVLTLDPTDSHMERVQSIVTLQEEGLCASMEHYFAQSDQFYYGLRLEAEKQEGTWYSEAIILHKLPGAGGTGTEQTPEEEEENWHRAQLLLKTVTKKELLDQDLPIETLLFRLFHEEEINVFPKVRIKDQCRCSRERVEAVLLSIPFEELEECAVNGEIVSNCEFCKSEERFPLGLIKERLEDKKRHLN